MKRFKQRSKELEMMDGETNPIILKQNYTEIERVNQYLGGHGTLLKGLSRFIDKSRTYTILDIGCGSGDAIRTMLKWANRRNYRLNIIGLDYNETAYHIASKAFEKEDKVEIICLDYKSFHPNRSIDVVCSNLFNHHLDDRQNKAYLKWAFNLAERGVIINDLHRHPLAYYSIKWIAKLARTSIYFRNDAPLSVLRAFSKVELKEYAHDTGLKIRIQWCWAFRWLIWIEK